MEIDSPARPMESAPPVSSEELAEGLMLVRASTLKMIRFQLAIERHDRRVALEAVDDLVAIDRQLQARLAQMPADGDRLLFTHQLDTERALLNREKLTLAAEVICKPADRLVEAESPAEDDWLGPTNIPIDLEEPRRRRWWLLAGLPVLVVTGLAASAYLFLPGETVTWVGAIAGTLR